MNRLPRLSWCRLERDICQQVKQRATAAFWMEAADCAHELGNSDYANTYRERAAGARTRADRLRRRILRGARP